MQEAIQHYIRIIEEAISQLGIDPAAARQQKPVQWNLTKGSARIALDIFQPDPKAPVYFGVRSPIMQVPQGSAEDFYSQLLRMNHQMVGAAFSVFQNIVFLGEARIIDGLDSREAFAIITTVANAADYYDDLLQKEFPHKRPIGFRPNGLSEDGQAQA